MSQNVTAGSLESLWKMPRSHRAQYRGLDIWGSLGDKGGIGVIRKQGSPGQSLCHGVSPHSSSTHECHKCAWQRLKTGVTLRTRSETEQRPGCLVTLRVEAAIWHGDTLPGHAGKRSKLALPKHQVLLAFVFSLNEAKGDAA